MAASRIIPGLLSVIVPRLASAETELGKGRPGRNGRPAADRGIGGGPLVALLKVAAG